jgi:hypothetical protein
MIKRPNNWNEVKEFTERPKLALGAYVCKVKKAIVQATDYGQQLCILFDIAEGTFKDFFDEDFKANTNQDKKWKGVLRVWIPKDDGSEKDEWTKSSFKGVITSFEKSNPGFQWNWDEASLAGKMIGVLFRQEEWEYNGKHGWAVRPFKALSVDTVRNGEFTIPAEKPLNNKSESSYGAGNYGGYGNNQTFTEMDDDGDLPF